VTGCNYLAVIHRLKTKRIQFFDSILEQNQSHTLTFGLTAGSTKPIAKQLRLKNKSGQGRKMILNKEAHQTKVKEIVKSERQRLTYPKSDRKGVKC
jgi:hypothetical protein